MPLASVARPHGVRGELRLTVFNEDSDLLLGRDEVIVHLPDGQEHEVSVDAVRRAGKAILIKLHSVDDRDRAEELRGATLGVRRDELPPLPDGEIYYCDVEGAEVRVAERSEPSLSGLLGGGAPHQDRREYRVGVVERVVEYPTAAVLVVRRDDGSRIEVPLIESYVEKIDTEKRVVMLSSIEGLS